MGNKDMGLNGIPDQNNSSDSAMSALQNQPIQSSASALTPSEYSQAMTAAERVNSQFGSSSINGASSSIPKHAVSSPMMDSTPNSVSGSMHDSNLNPNRDSRGVSSSNSSMTYQSESTNPSMYQSSRTTQVTQATRSTQSNQIDQADRLNQKNAADQQNEPNQQNDNNTGLIKDSANKVDKERRINKKNKKNKDKNDKKIDDSDKDKKDSLKNAKTSTHWAITISLIAIVCVIAVVALLFSIFVWPRWTERPISQGGASLSRGSTSQPQEMPATASMATPLPPHPSVLLQAMPDVVGIYARKEVVATSGWAQLQPNESYSIHYEGRNPKNAVTLILAQWTTPEDAKTQYNIISGGLKGDLVRSGNVSVNGHVTGDYRFIRSSKDHNEGVAVWRNATCIFEVRGPFDQVRNFYQEFPL